MLKNEPLTIRPSFFNLPALRRISAIAFLAGASSLALHAQQSTPLQSTPLQSAPMQSAPLVAANDNGPLNLAAAAGVTYSSSSSDVANPVDTAKADILTDAYQPPPRRRYGRPRYNDSAHNADGSNKYTFVLGAGMTAPVGNTYHYLNTSYGIEIGAGRNFNKNIGVLFEFNYDRFGFNGRTLYNQLQLYNYCPPTAPSSTCAAIAQNALTTLDGNTHDWSFGLQPVYTFLDGKSYGAYVTAGAGFYHKVANFTTPETGYSYYGYVTENAVIDHYTSNAPGFDGGFGLTYKPSRFSGEKLFVEARYVLNMNSQRQGLTVTNVTTTFGQNYTGYNDFPANSNRTTYTTYKAGVRF